MNKFLKITNAPITGQLISLEEIKSISTANATSTDVVINYFDGTATTVVTAAQVDHDVYTEIVSAIESAIATSFQNAYYNLVLSKAVTSITNVVNSTALLYDTYPAFYGVSSSRKLKTGITSIERDRRNSDNAEQNFTALEKTDGTLITFTGSAVTDSGFVVQPYDQSGNNFVVSQPNAALQPRTVFEGALVTGGTRAAWDPIGGGLGGFSSSTNFDLTDTGETYWFAVVDYEQEVEQQVLFMQRTSPWVTGASVIFFSNTSNQFKVIKAQPPTGANALSTFTNPAQGKRLITVRLSYTQTEDWCTVWYDGVEQVGVIPTAVASAGGANVNLHIGCVNGNTLPLQHKMQEFHIYKGDQSSNRVAIETDIMTYYNI